MTIQFEGAEVITADKSVADGVAIAAGDLYMAQSRDGGWKMLTCDKVNMATFCVFPREVAEIK